MTSAKPLTVTHDVGRALEVTTIVVSTHQRGILPIR